MSEEIKHTELVQAHPLPDITGESENFPHFRERINDLLGMVYALDRSGKLNVNSIAWKAQDLFSDIDSLYELGGSDSFDEAPDAVFSVDTGINLRGRTVFRTIRDGFLMRDVGLDIRCELDKSSDEIVLILRNARDSISGVPEFIPEDLGIDSIIIRKDRIDYVQRADRSKKIVLDPDIERKLHRSLDDATLQYSGFIKSVMGDDN